MIVAVVYQSPGGLNPLQIVEIISRQYLTQITSKQVLDTVERNSKLFVEIDGKIKSPSPPTSEETYKILK
jgi:hypothetical protein